MTIENFNICPACYRKDCTEYVKSTFPGGGLRLDFYRCRSCTCHYKITHKKEVVENPSLESAFRDERTNEIEELNREASSWKQAYNEKVKEIAEKQKTVDQQKIEIEYLRERASLIMEDLKSILKR